MYIFLEAVCLRQVKCDVLIINLINNYINNSNTCAAQTAADESAGVVNAANDVVKLVNLADRRAACQYQEQGHQCHNNSGNTAETIHPTAWLVHVCLQH